MNRLGRPPAPFIMNAIKNDIEFVVGRGSGIWAVLLDGKPVTVFGRLHYSDRQRYYRPTVYTNRGSAERTCAKLNGLFVGNRFSVKQVL
jgi:hypothetical protein